MSVLTLTATDNISLPVYLARPTATPQAALVVLHEAFAVTPHIRRVCDDYARAGFVCLAPDLLARNRLAEAGQSHPQVHPLWEHVGPAPDCATLPSLPVTGAGLDLARQYITAIPREQNLMDIEACVSWLHDHYPELNTGVIGYCFGGSMAYYSAAHRPDWFAACVPYYGGMLAEAAAYAQPRCPTLVHLAEHDRYIDLHAAQAALATHHPQAEVLVHAADHGFNRDDGVTYDAAVAQTARTRTMAFLHQHLVNAG